jgi:hypothetical protein
VEAVEVTLAEAMDRRPNECTYQPIPANTDQYRPIPITNTDYQYRPFVSAKHQRCEGAYVLYLHTSHQPTCRMRTLSQVPQALAGRQFLSIPGDGPGLTWYDC